MDMIAAIATGSAATAIGIVRVSGEGCFALCDRVFRAANGRPFAGQAPRKMIFGEMLTGRDGSSTGGWRSGSRGQTATPGRTAPSSTATALL